MIDRADAPRICRASDAHNLPICFLRPADAFRRPQALSADALCIIVVVRKRYRSALVPGIPSEQPAFNIEIGADNDVTAANPKCDVRMPCYPVDHIEIGVFGAVNGLLEKGFDLVHVMLHEKSPAKGLGWREIIDATDGTLAVNFDQLYNGNC